MSRHEDDEDGTFSQLVACIHYNLACCFSLQDKQDLACASLTAAVEAGFFRFKRLRADPDLAAIRQHPKVDSLLDQHITRIYEAARRGQEYKVETWLNQGGSKDAAISGGKTLLYGAAHRGETAVVKLLLESGAKRDKASDAGVTPLMAAADGMHWETMRVIIETPGRVVDVNAADKTGVTALHVAAGCERADINIIELLYKSGANPLAETRAKKMPIDMVPQSLAGPGSEVPVYLARVTGAAQLVHGSGLKDILGGISIVAVLVVTVTFIGVLTPPGGPSAAGFVRFSGDGASDPHPHSAALRAYFFFNSFSLFGAATDLLLVLLFTLPGISRRYRGVQQVRRPGFCVACGFSSPSF